MLEEMGGPVGVVGLEPRPGVDPHPDGGGAGGEARLGGDAEAVGERGDAGEGRGGPDGDQAGAVGLPAQRRPEPSRAVDETVSPIQSKGVQLINHH